MTRHPESTAPEFPRLTRQVERHVQRHLERGDDVFYARPALAALAISLMGNGRRFRAEDATDEAALATLAAHGAQGEVVTPVYDLGNGPESGRDKIIVTHRDGRPTSAEL